MSVAVFNNYDHEKTVKQTLQPTEIEYGGTAKNHIPNLLKKVKGNYLGILLFLDKDKDHKCLSLPCLIYQMLLHLGGQFFLYEVWQLRFYSIS